MQKRDSLVLIVAAVTGLFSFILIANYLKSTAGNKLQFVVVARPIAKGQSIVQEDVYLSKPMQNKTPEALYMHAEDVIGNIASQDMAKDSLVYRTQILPPETAPSKKTEALPIPPGMSSMTLSASQIDGIPENIETGSYVDILGTITNPEGATNIQPVARGAQILSVQRANDSEVKSITIAVTSNGAIAVSKAMAHNPLGIVLRSGALGKGDNRSLELESIEIIRGIEKVRTAKVKQDR